MKFISGTKRIMEKAYNGVEDTLFIPLAGRAYTSKRFPDMFYDAKALGLARKIDVKSIVEKSDEYTMLANAARYYNMDKIAKEFIKRNPKSNIINIGAGLETMYNRIDCDDCTFYELDLPDVIDIRRKFLKERKNDSFIGCDMFDLSWSAGIDRDKPTLIVASGVFQYFQEKKLIAFLSDVTARFSNLELIFDATNTKGLKFTNKYVEKTGNMNARMYFAVDDVKVFANKLPGQAKIIKDVDFFSEVRPLLKGRIKMKTYLYMFFCDMLNRAKIYHMKLKGDI